MSQNALQGEFEKFDASAFRVGIVVAQFNRDVSEALLASAFEMCAAYQISQTQITVEHVAGCVEIPVVLQALAETGKYDCLVGFGTIIRGDTPHFDYVAKMVSEGILRVMLDNKIPVGFGVLTCENRDQALARVTTGASTMEAAIQSAKTVENIRLS